MAGKQQFCKFPFRTGARTATAELRIVVGLAMLALMPQSAFNQTHEGSVAGVHTLSRLEPPTQNVRAFPRVSLGVGRELEYLGTFCANAKYKKPSKFTRALEALGSISRVHFSLWRGRGKADRGSFVDASFLPAGLWRISKPPAHATKLAQPNSNLAAIRDAIVTFAYGPARVMGDAASS